MIVRRTGLDIDLAALSRAICGVWDAPYEDLTLIRVDALVFGSSMPAADLAAKIFVPSVHPAEQIAFANYVLMHCPEVDDPFLAAVFGFAGAVSGMLKLAERTVRFAVGTRNPDHLGAYLTDDVAYGFQLYLAYFIHRDRAEIPLGPFWRPHYLIASKMYRLAGFDW